MQMNVRAPASLDDRSCGLFHELGQQNKIKKTKNLKLKLECVCVCVFLCQYMHEVRQIERVSHIYISLTHTWLSMSEPPPPVTHTRTRDMLSYLTNIYIPACLVVFQHSTTKS